jgi:hypothetical protein
VSPEAGAAPSRAPRAAGGTSTGATFRRPGVVTLLAVLSLIGGALGVAGALLIGAAGMQASGGQAQLAPMFLAIAGVNLVLGALNVVAGLGLLQLRPWARTLQIVLASLALLGIPCGTVYGVLVLVYMLKPEVKLLFSGAAPRELDPAELAMVERLGEGSSVVVVIVALAVVVTGVAGVGIVAAIAIPSLLRARVSANEAASIGDLRTMVSAQTAYASANAGLYDSIECLATPHQCIPGYEASGPVFLDAGFRTPTRHGYSFRFVAGPKGAAEQAAGGSTSPSSIRSFAYIAEPVNPGQTGVRAFCGDASGLICFSLSGRVEDGNEGACPSSCSPIQ